jgi:putative SOS response-associated peptidase YedK
MPYNDRMPVLLAKSEYERWLHGSISDVIEFQFRKPMVADRIAVTHTEDRWRSGAIPDFTATSQMALL